jgi:hypothetical protein
VGTTRRIESTAMVAWSVTGVGWWNVEPQAEA